MNLGELLYKIWEHVYGLVPFGVVNTWQQGVRMRMGNVRKLLLHDNGWFGSGLHFFIPILEEILVEDASTAVVITRAQVSTTHDGKVVVMSFVATYNIANYQKVIETVYQTDDIVVGAIQSIAGALICQMTYAQARDNLADMVFEELHKRLDTWGLNLEEVTVKSFAKCTAHRLIGGES